MFYPLNISRENFQKLFLVLSSRSLHYQKGGQFNYFFSRKQIPLYLFQTILYYTFGWTTDICDNFLELIPSVFFQIENLIPSSNLNEIQIDFVLLAFFQTFQEIGGTVYMDAGKSLLMMVSKYNAPHTLRYLLQKGIDPNSLSFDLRTPLHNVAEKGNSLPAKVLLQYKCQILNDANGFSPIWLAVKHNHMELALLLKDYLDRSIEHDPSTFPKFPGEIELNSRKVLFSSNKFNPYLEGQLFVTNFRLYFQPRLISALLKNRKNFIPLLSIAQIKKLKKEKGIKLICKDFRSPRILFQTDWGDSLFNILTQASFTENPKKFFAFQFAPHFPFPPEDDGWDIYDPESEIRRIFKVKTNDALTKFGWRISQFNRNYQFCPSYPPSFAIPEYTQDEDFEQIASFRSNSRIPILSWYDLPTTASISRSSQPQVGRTGRERNLSDESHFQRIVSTTKSRKIIILDARPRLNAVANQAQKGGFETASFYGNCEFEFLDIGNIHVMRESLEKFKKALLTSKDRSVWWNQVHESKWFDHLSLLLQGSAKIAKNIRAGISVLVHCSDGWDRTSQLVSLALLILDPFYRTIKGFEILVEKEWCATGHQFDKRTGHGSKNFSDSQRAPIFTQWLDCVFQFTNQFPDYFQFNQDFLVEIHDALYSGQFGTFLYDTEKDRSERAKQFKNFSTKVRSTVSLWSMINQNQYRFTNPNYDAKLSDYIFPKTDLPFLNVWKGNYFRFIEGGIKDVNPIDEMLSLKLKMYQMEKAYELDLSNKMKVQQWRVPRSTLQNTPINTPQSPPILLSEPFPKSLFQSNESASPTWDRIPLVSSPIPEIEVKNHNDSTRNPNRKSDKFNRRAIKFDFKENQFPEEVSIHKISYTSKTQSSDDSSLPTRPPPSLSESKKLLKQEREAQLLLVDDFSPKSATKMSPDVIEEEE